jgi:PKD repeat protein
MKKFSVPEFKIVAIILNLLLFTTIAQAQIEVNLLTNCATDKKVIPVQIKRFENISAFDLYLNYDPQIISFKRSLIHNQTFNLNNDSRYAIRITNENNRLRIQWNAYYGISLSDDVLLFLEFEEVSVGNAGFSWNQTDSHIFKIGNIEQTVNYSVITPYNLPHISNYKIDIQQISQGCRDDSENGCKAQAIVKLTGGLEPYSYLWNDKFNQKTQTAIGLCQKPVSVIVKDAAACYFGNVIEAKIYPANQMSITADPEIIYITNPNVDFHSEYLNSKPQSYLWNFGDETTATTEHASHTYQNVANYKVSLFTRSTDGCDTTVYINNFEVRELDFCIPNVFTPNGDNINDKWVFKIGNPPSTNANLKTGYFDTKICTGEDLIFKDHFKYTRLIVLNRNGVKVFECTNCNDSWDGGDLPDDVYFYVFEWEGEFNKGREQGDVTILRGK